MNFFLLILFSFVMGSIPFGAAIARVKGINLREVGSGNIGATNVLRSAGRIPAVLTLAGDIMKGAIPVVIANSLLRDPLTIGIIGLSAISGHIFSVFLSFKGGKGVATSIGVLLAYSPLVAVITVVLWLAVAGITRYSSLGAVVSFAVLPLSMYLFDPVREKMIVSAIITILLLLKHVDNIQRLIRGTESRIGEKVR
jgi:glycerol-3-phosphate acyltransferase PlsY